MQLVILIKGPFKYRNDKFPFPSIYLHLWNPYPFIYLNPKKGTPFGVEPPRIGHYREYPLGIIVQLYRLTAAGIFFYNNITFCIFVPLNLAAHGDAASVYFFMVVTCTLKLSQSAFKN